MNKTLKTIITVVIIVAVLGLAIAGFFIIRHLNTYISREAALEIALKDAGQTKQSVYSIDIEFENVRGMAWYDVDFDTHTLEYSYRIDAISGEILNAYSEPND